MKLIVQAGVRYWEDATVNGVEDTFGELIPFRKGDDWCPTIDLNTGRVLEWPEGTTANIHYKVCDAGEYWLEDENGKRWKWDDHYVPDYLLCVEDNGYGDYIILKIDGGGFIQGWKQPRIDMTEWKEVKA